MKQRHLLIATVFGVLLSAAPAAQAGPKIAFGDAGSLSIGVLGQVQGSWVDGAQDDFDIFLRRGRLIFSGEIADGIKIFTETDFANAGKTGTSASFVVQDAFADVRVAGDHKVQAGLILLPFSFETLSSAGSLLGLDYNAEAIKFTNTLVWRDLGLQASGNFGTRAAYKIGVFDGYDAAEKNVGADQRFTGHVAVNVIGDVETGWFANQVRLDAPTYLSLGAGFDTQGNATVKDGNVADSDAWVVDLQSKVKIEGIGSIVANAAYYDWDNTNFKGNTAFVEAGFLYQNAMVTGKWALQAPDQGDDVTDYTVGLHYFLKGHALRGGIEYRTGDSPDSVLAQIQFLL